MSRCKSPHHEVVKHIERVFQKNSLNPNAASHNNTSWYTSTDGFLEHSPSGGIIFSACPPKDNSSLYWVPSLYMQSLCKWIVRFPEAACLIRTML